MFLTLFRKECVQYLKSVTYYIFVVCLVLDFLTQMGTFETVDKPEPGQEDYGYTRTENKDIIMEEALAGLIDEYERGEYTTYPIGFYKKVVLDEEEQKQVAECICRITGLNTGDLEKALDDRNAEVQAMIDQYGEDGIPVMENEFPDVGFTVKEGYSYEEFFKEMKAIDELLGGGSDYSEENLRYAEEPRTYEQAMADYNSFIKEDKVTSAYARLFCDYMGIMLAILPVFLAVTRALKDRKAQAEQVIYMRRAGSFTVVASRYTAAAFMVVIPVLLLSCYTLTQAVYYAENIHVEYDVLAFVKYIGFWLLPTILVSLSVGFFLTELTDSAMAVLVQGAWWFVSIFLNTGNLVGTVGWNLIPRFNSVGEYDIYEQMREQLMRNRFFYTGMALALLLLTVWIYSKKRKGEFVSVGTMLRNRKSKLEA